MREEVEELKKELSEVKEQSWAMEVLHDYKAANKRLFVALIVVLCMWFATIGAFIYYINTTDYVEVEEMAEVENEDGNANACVGDSCNNGEINYGKSKSN